LLDGVSDPAFGPSVGAVELGHLSRKQCERSDPFEAALALPEAGRVQRVERLLETLGPQTDGVDEASFLAELHRCSTEIDQGKSKLVPWPELKFEPY